MTDIAGILAQVLALKDQILMHYSNGIPFLLFIKYHIHEGHANICISQNICLNERHEFRLNIDLIQIISV